MLIASSRIGSSRRFQPQRLVEGDALLGISDPVARVNEFHRAILDALGQCFSRTVDLHGA